MGIWHKSWGPWIPVATLGCRARTGIFGPRFQRAHRVILAGHLDELFGEPDPATFDLVHHLIRKTGHFLGYAILSGLSSGRCAPPGNAAGDTATHARLPVAIALGTDGRPGNGRGRLMDEIHQTFNPARTGRWQDVILDCCGAITLQVLMYLAILFRSRKVEPLRMLDLCALRCRLNAPSSNKGTSS